MQTYALGHISSLAILCFRGSKFSTGGCNPDCVGDVTSTSFVPILAPLKLRYHAALQEVESETFSLLASKLNCFAPGICSLNKSIANLDLSYEISALFDMRRAVAGEPVAVLANDNQTSLCVEENLCCNQFRKKRGITIGAAWWHILPMPAAGGN